MTNILKFDMCDTKSVTKAMAFYRDFERYIKQTLHVYTFEDGKIVSDEYCVVVTPDFYQGDLT